MSFTDSPIKKGEPSPMICTPSLNTNVNNDITAAEPNGMTTIDMGNNLNDMVSAAAPAPGAGAALTQTKTNSINKVQGYDITCESISYIVNIKDDETSTLFKTQYKPLQLLTDVTASFPAGKMTALMGSSGAGKSTLMDVVAGRKTAGELVGDVLFDSQGRPENFKRIAGYVEQRDIVIETLTVYECLYYTAELKLPAKHFTKEQKEKRIEQIILDLGINKCRDTIVGNALHRGISGGELKRLCIGLELITLPPILFLDEPTSGLDSATTIDVVNVLRGLAANGHTIICTIHQPSAEAFSMFDQLLLLSKGRVAYSGDAKGGAPYLRELGFSPINEEEFGFNPAEFLLSVTGGGTGNGIQTVAGPEGVDFGVAWENSKYAEARKESVTQKVLMGNDNLKERDIREGNTFFHQLYTLTSRCFVSANRDKNFLNLRITKNVMVALIFLSVYYDVYNNAYPNTDLIGFLFMIITLWGMNGIGYVSSMISDREVFYRERAVGSYSVLPHFLSKIVLEWPYGIIVSLLFTIIVFFGCGFKNLFDNTGYADNFFIMWLIVFLVNEVAHGFATFISSFAPDINVAIGLAPMMMVIQFLFAGFLITASNIPVYWRYTMRYISFFTYGFAALSNNILQGTDQEGLLDKYELKDLTMWENVVVLFAISLAWRLLAYLCLRFVKHYER